MRLFLPLSLSLSITLSISMCKSQLSTSKIPRSLAVPMILVVVVGCDE